MRPAGFEHDPITNCELTMRLISRSELARLAGVSPPAITKQTKRWGPSVIVRGKVNLDAPAVREYLERHGVGSTPPPSPDASAAPSAASTAAPSGVDIRTLGDMTLRELVRRFGGVGPGAEEAAITRLADWQARLKTVEDIREKRLRNEESEGQLISRELVRTHLLGMIDAGNRRLLTDAPRTIARRLYALAKSGEPVEDAERLVRETIGSQLEVVKANAVRTLRHGVKPGKDTAT